MEWEGHGEEITDSGSTAGCRLARVVIQTPDHLHYIAGIQPRMANVGKLVAALVSHLVIRQVAMLGHVVVEFNIFIPSFPRRLRFPWTAGPWGFESLADRQNVTEHSGHVQRKFKRFGLLKGFERSRQTPRWLLQKSGCCW